MIDADTVIARLEEATSTILAMPGGMPRGGLKVCDYGYDTAFFDEWAEGETKPAESGVIAGLSKKPAPSAASITRADEIITWLGLIPANRYVLRKIVAARSMIKWTTGKHVNSWRKIGLTLGADYKAIQRWHAQGIKIIVDALNRKG